MIYELMMAIKEEIMDISIREHHGYFSLDMGYYHGAGFCNNQVQRMRLSLIYILSGQGTLNINGHDFSYDAPALLCMNESEVINIPCDASVCAILFHPSIINSALNFDNIRRSADSLNLTEQQDCFYFQPFLTRLPDFSGMLFPAFDTANRIQELFDSFSVQVTQQDNDHWACRSRSNLIELLSLANSCMEHHHELFSAKKESNNNEILRIIAYLESNLHTKITIADLTKRFQMNRTYLSRLFLNYTGETIMQFVNRTRMELASTLLRDTTIPMSEVMERAGFSDYSYFSKTFRKYKGMSPRNYRKKYCWMLPTLP